MSRIKCAEVGVQDLEPCLEAWLAARGSRDLQGLLEEAKEVLTWKSAPRAAVMAAYADLASGFVAKVIMQISKSLVSITACIDKIHCFPLLHNLERGWPKFAGSSTYIYSGPEIH